MDLNNFFQLTPIPSDVISGSYNLYLVALSYFIACLASYVALDITERIRTSGETLTAKLWWLILGAFAMGMGIWTMHFIGMLAFIMPVPMDYEPVLTGVSLILAVVASAFAFFLIKNNQVKVVPLMMGGILLGIGIVSMHYTGMLAMLDVKIRYIPSLFFLSIAIAIVASESALWLMIKSSKISSRFHAIMKIGSSLIMGLAICGMHYTGMEAAVFYHTPFEKHQIMLSTLDPSTLSIYIAITTLLIMSIALAASRFWMYALQSRNKKLLETEAILEQKGLELQQLNQNLFNLAESSKAKEDKISAILTAAADGIIVMDDQGVIEICNRVGAEILGYSSEEILSQNMMTLIGQKEEDAEKPFQPISIASLIEKEDMLVEFIGLRKNKQIVPIELSISRSVIKNKVLYIIVFRDITERKQAEKDLKALNLKLVSTARVAGMADVAASVLHNVGNVLNSINISAQILLERDSSSQLPGLIRVADLLDTHKHELDVFLKTNPVGQNLPEYFNQFAIYWKNERDFNHKELESLKAKVLHIKNIIAMQQLLSGNTNIMEKVQINSLLEDALAINSEMIEKYGIIIERNYKKITSFEIDKVKTLQILINLIKNAAESLIESNKKEKKITLRTKIVDNDYVHIEVTDNGIGIKPENILNIFTHGFTTKKTGHGFGLHASALSAQEAGGSLKAYSEGENQGATFILILPKKM
jgi:PAS domain S-box-containing protein